MKKSTRMFLLAILFAASFSSYCFLSHTATTPTSVEAASVEIVEETNSSKFVMPEVDMIQKAIELTKAFVPGQ